MMTKEIYNAIEHMLQGLCYYIGYRKELYAGRSIPEAVIVDKAIDILLSHLGANYHIECECAYSSLGCPTSKSLRADLVIRKKPGFCEDCLYGDVCVLEFKRSSDANGGIFADFNKMSNLPSGISKVEVLIFENGAVTGTSKLEKSLLDSKGRARGSVTLSDSKSPHTEYQVDVFRATKVFETVSAKRCIRLVGIEFLAIL